MGVKEMPYHLRLSDIAEQLPKGAFLVTKAKDVANIMTIGWCLMGYMWNRPIFQIVVRTSRYTYSLIEESRNFTVSFPRDQTMEKELLYCGTHSGRTVDKVKECGLTLLPALKLESPIVNGCGLYYECKILAQQRLPIETIPGDATYEEDSKAFYHGMYYGEILASYSLE